jgi:hypothetical protein
MSQGWDTAAVDFEIGIELVWVAVVLMIFPLLLN